jgi:2-oxoisovalerate dehydrogenase E2 component (dihydrolipoyl transacylase)
VSRYAFRLPDLGEGTVSAEIVSWLVKPGDQVREGQPIAEMSTEKAVVELPAPVTGKVISLGGVPGDAIAVGAELIVFDSGTDGATANVTSPGAATPDAATAGPAAARAPGNRRGTPAPVAAPAPPAASAMPAAPATGDAQPHGDAARVRTSPATRRRAREAGIDLVTVQGTGPRGRIQPDDLSQAISARGDRTVAATVPAPGARASGITGEVEEIKVLGVRRFIAQRMSAAKRSIPHFGYVEEIDVTELESLRLHLAAAPAFKLTKLTPLPFIVKALTRALQRFPQCNAHYDEARETIVRHRAMHAGIATQTRDGLKVPVVRNAQLLSLSQLAQEITRVSQAARSNQAKREDLSGSTITVTSLGKLGGIASTPVINAPEVAIVGINRIAERPVVHRGAIVVRQMMNLSSSFDHRFVDGFDAAAFIQAVKELLEHPATIFMDD